MGLKDVIETAGEIRKEIKQERAEKREQIRKHRAEMARIRAIQEAKALESYNQVIEAINAHNAAHHYYKITLWENRPVEKCGPWTIVQDCKDKNCYRHYDEKKAMAAAKAEKPVSLLDSLFEQD
jgi:hypothetical protein